MATDSLIIQQRHSDSTSHIKTWDSNMTNNSPTLIFIIVLHCFTPAHRSNLLYGSTKVALADQDKTDLLKSIVTSDYSLQMIIFKLSLTAREASCKIPILFTYIFCELILEMMLDSRADIFLLSLMVRETKF